MLLQEGLNELKLIKKRIQSNISDLAKGSAWSTHAPNHPWSVEEGAAPDIKRAEAKAQSLLQSCDDLLARYLDLKLAIDYTNLVTNITVRKMTYSIAQALLMRREFEAGRGEESKGYATLVTEVTQAVRGCAAKALVDVTKFNNQLEANRLNVNMSEIIYLVDPNKVDKNLERFEGFLSELDAQLQIANATKEIIFDIPLGRVT